MPIELQICLVICVLLFACFIIHSLVRKKFNLKYSLVWLFSVLCMLIVVIFPQTVEWLSNLLGIELQSNAVFFFAILFLVTIVLTLTSIVSKINNHIYRLTQTQAILEQRIRELEAERNTDQND